MNGTATVILAAYTRDRLGFLRAGLVALAGQDPRPHEVVLVVDNNPDLADVARTELTGLYPGLRVVEHDGAPGAAAARNTGAGAATGDVLVFLDDDATPEPGWLAALTGALGEAGVQVAGGVAAPVFPGGRRPAWMPPAFDWTVGCHPDHTPDRTHDVRNVWGVSMAVRAATFAAHGGFDTGLGRVGTTPLGGEETDLCIRIRQADPSARVVLVPDARVRHNVSAYRCHLPYFLSRCHAEGLSKAAIRARVGSDAVREEKAYTTRVLPAAVGRGLREAATGDVTGLARAAAVVAGTGAAAAGYARGLLHRQ